MIVKASLPTESCGLFSRKQYKSTTDSLPAGWKLSPGKESLLAGAAAYCWLTEDESWTSRQREAAIGMPLALGEAEEKLKIGEDETAWSCLGPEAMLVTGGIDSTQKSSSLHVSSTFHMYQTLYGGRKHRSPQPEIPESAEKLIRLNICVTCLHPTEHVAFTEVYIMGSVPLGVQVRLMPRKKDTAAYLVTCCSPALSVACRVRPQRPCSKP